MTTNFVTLHSCAYLFHSSNNNYYISKKAHEAAKIAQKFLKDNSLKPLPYTITENGNILVVSEGLNIYINDSMILEITGEYNNKDVVNGRIFKDLFKFHTDNWKHFERFNNYKNGNDQYFWGSKFKSLEIEKFSASLMYYRIHFKGNRICIISSLGRLFLAEHSNYREISKEYIFDRLGASSNEVKRILNSFLDFITEE